jgi:hypothetical protein
MISSHVTAKPFMGRGVATAKSKIEVPLSRKDTPEKIKNQWDALRTAFSDPNRALVFHLKNHYALVFALREWVEASPPDAAGSSSTVRVVREILTSRRGQRPSAWVPFMEARETMLGWEGYKILAIDRETSSTEVQESLRSVKETLQNLRVDESFGIIFPAANEDGASNVDNEKGEISAGV